MAVTEMNLKVLTGNKKYSFAPLNSKGLSSHRIIVTKVNDASFTCSPDVQAQIELARQQPTEEDILQGLKTHILAKDIEKHLSLTSIRQDVDSKLPINRTVVGSAKQYAESYLEKTEMV
jgi:hypothetical protein